MDGFENVDAQPPAEIAEVGHGERLPTRRFVPAFGQIDDVRNAAGEQQLQPATPEPPVRKADDRAAAYPQHLAQDHGRIVQKRQRLAQDHRVEAGVGIIGQALFQITLPDAESAAHAGQHARLAALHPAARHLLAAHQMFEQRAVPAAQVQHAGPGRHHVGDRQQVGPQQPGVLCGGDSFRGGRRPALLGHATASAGAGPAAAGGTTPSVWTSRSRNPRSSLVMVPTSSRNAS